MQFHCFCRYLEPRSYYTAVSPYSLSFEIDNRFLRNAYSYIVCTENTAAVHMKRRPCRSRLLLKGVVDC